MICFKHVSIEVFLVDAVGDAMHVIPKWQGGEGEGKARARSMTLNVWSSPALDDNCNAHATTTLPLQDKHEPLRLDLSLTASC
jgi:hypothetical protein